MHFKANLNLPDGPYIGSPWFPTTGALWKRNTVYPQGSVIQDPAANLQYALVVAGDMTSGGREPVWSETLDTETVDNNITWFNLGKTTPVPGISNKQIVGVPVGPSAGATAYLDREFSPDQFVEFTVGLWNLGLDFSTLQVFFRTDVKAVPGKPGYNVQLSVNSPPDGVHSNVSIVDNLTQNVLFLIPSLVTGPGDKWRVEVKDVTISLFQNGKLLGSIVDYLHSFGGVGLGIVDNTNVTDATFASFEAGDITPGAVNTLNQGAIPEIGA